MLLVSSILVTTLFGLSAAAGDEVVNRGEYVWKVDGHRNEVEAVFTPRGEDTWDVEFRFAYARRRGVYQGMARGSLRDGVVHGEVRDNGGVLRYGFELVVEGDRLEGQHFDIWSGRKKLNGTLRLERIREADGAVSSAEGSLGDRGRPLIRDSRASRQPG